MAELRYLAAIVVVALGSVWVCDHFLRPEPVPTYDEAVAQFMKSSEDGPPKDQDAQDGRASVAVLHPDRTLSASLPEKKRGPYRYAGRYLPPWRLAEWSPSEPIRWQDLRGSVVVVRFWHDRCAYCRHSLRAMQQLADEFNGKPVRFIGIYLSPQTDADGPWDVAVGQARRWGVTFPIAYDRGWRTHTRWCLVDDFQYDYFSFMPTSVTFVIDPAGKIVHAHPGPEFQPSDDPINAQSNEDFLAIRKAIEDALPPLSVAEGFRFRDSP